MKIDPKHQRLALDLINTIAGQALENEDLRNRKDDAPFLLFDCGLEFDFKELAEEEGLIGEDGLPKDELFDEYNELFFAIAHKAFELVDSISTLTK